MTKCGARIAQDLQPPYPAQAARAGRFLPMPLPVHHPTLPQLVRSCSLCLGGCFLTAPGPCPAASLMDMPVHSGQHDPPNMPLTATPLQEVAATATHMQTGPIPRPPALRQPPHLLSSHAASRSTGP